MPTTLLGSDYSIHYADFVAGNPAVRVGDLNFKALAAGQYALNATAIVQADPNANGTWTGDFYFHGNSVGDFGINGPFTTDRGQEIAIATVGEAFLPANELVTVNVRRTSGTNLLQCPASLNTVAQWSIAPM